MFFILGIFDLTSGQLRRVQPRDVTDFVILKTLIVRAEVREVVGWGLLVRDMSRRPGA
jgi:hypothetical protein